jgi:two-component system, NtrC family, sensor kinase
VPRSLKPMSPPTERLVSSALAALGEVAVRLASGDELEEKMAGVLETAREVLDASDCTLWLSGPRGLVRAWSAGDGRNDADDIAARLDADVLDDDGLVIRRMHAADLRLGALSARVHVALSHEQELFFSTLANLLAPELSHTAHSHQLGVEVEIRTRQIDEERKFTERIIDSLPVGLYVIDREYRIQAWNRKRETGMQGVSRDEAIGRTIFEILHRQPEESLRREFEDVFRTGRIQIFHMESRASGDARSYRITKIPMRLGDGAVTHVITIGEDVTEWKDAQERFAQTEKLAAIGQLAAGVMHEINNPLATIAACAESLGLRLEEMRDVGHAAARDSGEFLRIIDNEVQRCKRIIDGLLDFSRPKPLTKESTDINAVIEQTLFLVKHHSRFKKLGVETLLEPDLARVRANAEQLVQVFMALLINAADAIGESGSIKLRTRRGRTSRDAVIAEVIDDGHGIARSETSKIFEPFYTTKAPGRGTGLGLSICYGIVAEHDGQIEVDSMPGTGSVFRILLPAEVVA